MRGDMGFNPLGVLGGRLVLVFPENFENKDGQILHSGCIFVQNYQLQIQCM
jgi:hypothetical protein